MKAATACIALVLASIAPSAMAQGMTRPDGFTCVCWADIDQPLLLPGGGRSYVCPPGPRTVLDNLPQRTFIRAGETIIASCERPLGSPNDTPTTYNRDSSLSDTEEDDRK